MKETYLGDGVYASFDGYHIWLAVSEHNNKVVALEPSVFRGLIAYAQEIGFLRKDIVKRGEL